MCALWMLPLPPPIEEDTAFFYRNYSNTQLVTQKKCFFFIFWAASLDLMLVTTAQQCYMDMWQFWTSEYINRNESHNVQEYNGHSHLEHENHWNAEHDQSVDSGMHREPKL